MGRTVGELLDSCSYLELVEWGDLYHIDPFGEWRGDVRSAMIASVLANVNRDPEQRSKPFEIDDFMPFKLPKKEEEIDGAKIGPETVAWLFAMGNKSVH